VAKCVLTQGWIQAGRRSPIPGFVAVNAQHKTGILPPETALAVRATVCTGKLALALPESSEYLKESQ